MAQLEFREMQHEDVAAAAGIMAAGEWANRGAFLEWAIASPATNPIVGLEGGRIVATGMATPSGSVGWVGMIYVDPARRRRGYGQAITEAVCERLSAAGCRTMALIASEFGRPVYERMGFRIEAWHQIWEAEPCEIEPTAPDGARLRPATVTDLDRICLLDRRATGEDRTVLLMALLDRTWILETDDGRELLGVLAQQANGSGTLEAADPADAAVLLDQLRRNGYGKVDTVRAALVRPPNGVAPLAARRLLAARGWAPAFETPRMLRGPSPDWDPTLMWGLLGFAFG